MKKNIKGQRRKYKELKLDIIEIQRQEDSIEKGKYQENPEQEKEYKKKKYQENPKPKKEYKKKKYQEDPEPKRKYEKKKNMQKIPSEEENMKK